MCQVSLKYMEPNSRGNDLKMTIFFEGASNSMISEKVTTGAFFRIDPASSGLTYVLYKKASCHQLQVTGNLFKTLSSSIATMQT